MARSVWDTQRPGQSAVTSRLGRRVRLGRRRGRRIEVVAVAVAVPVAVLVGEVAHQQGTEAAEDPALAAPTWMSGTILTWPAPTSRSAATSAVCSEPMAWRWASKPLARASAERLLGRRRGLADGLGAGGLGGTGQW